jgi:hypothetical protein
MLLDYEVVLAVSPYASASWTYRIVFKWLPIGKEESKITADRALARMSSSEFSHHVVHRLVLHN